MVNISRLSWRKVPRAVQPQATEADANTLSFPVEIWRKVVRFVTRLAGATNVSLDNAFEPAFLDEEYPEVDIGIFLDRRNVALVCSAWADMVRDVSAEYLVIYSGKQLKHLVKRLEADKGGTAGRRFGQRTTRVDFKIVGSYSVQHAAQLFKSTPNLMIYSNKNGPADQPVRYTPHDVLKSLVENCGPSLQRLEWGSSGEPPRYQDLAFLCNRLPNLTTLRLMAIYSYPRFPDGARPLLLLPSLTTLSLGIIPEPPTHQERFAVTWDPLLHFLSVSEQQLPQLTRFECDLFPQQPDTLTFFTTHGKKLKSFRTTTSFADVHLPAAVSACPNLLELSIVHGAEVAAFPLGHSNVERICLLPTIDVKVEVPRKIFANAILNPLDAIMQCVENMVAPRLKEVRIRNVGGFSAIVDQDVWLSQWSRRWGFRGISFVNQLGVEWRDYDHSTYL